MRSTQFLVLAVSVVIVNGRLNTPSSSLSSSDFCERIHPEELPEECTCTEPEPLGLVIECLKPFESAYFNDTIGMKIDLEVCNPKGSSLSVEITEETHHIDFPIAGINAGEETNIPIPGLSIAVPKIGNVGVDAAVLIYGNPDMLTLKIGLNACIAIGEGEGGGGGQGQGHGQGQGQARPHHKELCASSIPGLTNILPWYVLSGTYSFGDICNSTTTSSTSTSTSTMVATDE